MYDKLNDACETLLKELEVMMQENDYFDIPMYYERSINELNEDLFFIKRENNKKTMSEAIVYSYIYVLDSFKNCITHEAYNEQFWLFRLNVIMTIFQNNVFTEAKFQKVLKSNPISICNTSSIEIYSQFMESLFEEKDAEVI